MWVLPFIGYIGLLGGFAFLTLAIASGLYYLSELVEEHTVPAKKLLTRLIYVIIVLQVLLTLVDGLPWLPSAVGIASHVIYLQNMRSFPIVRLTDPIFILSCLLVLLNHYLWFKHFSAPPSTGATSYYSTSQSFNLPSFTEIASFFFLQVWLVPFALFVSLSASENVLPSMGSEFATDPGSPLNASAGAASGASSSMGLNFLTSRGGQGQDAGGAGAFQGGGLGDVGGKRKKVGAKGMVRVAVDGVREWVGETGELMGLWQGDRTRRW